MPQGKKYNAKTTHQQADIRQVSEALSIFPALPYRGLRRLLPFLSDDRLKRAVRTGVVLGKFQNVGYQKSADKTISLVNSTRSMTPDRMLAYWVFNQFAPIDTTHSQIINGRGESELFYITNETMNAIVILSTHDCRSRTLRLSEGELDKDDVNFFFAFLADQNDDGHAAQIQMILDRIIPPVRAKYHVLLIELNNSLLRRPNIIEVDTSTLVRKL